MGLFYIVWHMHFYSVNLTQAFAYCRVFWDSPWNNSAPYEFSVCPDWDRLFPQLLFLTGVFAVLGHMFPLWRRFKGGKGAGAALVVLLAGCWPAGLLACGAWGITALATRHASVAALVALGLSPLPAWYFGDGPIAGMAAFLAVLVWWKHRNNIRRLLAGTEPKIGKKKPAAEA